LNAIQIDRPDLSDLLLPVKIYYFQILKKFIPAEYEIKKEITDRKTAGTGVFFIADIVDYCNLIDYIVLQVITKELL